MPKQLKASQVIFWLVTSNSIWKISLPVNKLKVRVKKIQGDRGSGIKVGSTFLGKHLRVTLYGLNLSSDRYSGETILSTSEPIGIVSTLAEAKILRPKRHKRLMSKKNRRIWKKLVGEAKENHRRIDSLIDDYVVIF